MGHTSGNDRYVSLPSLTGGQIRKRRQGGSGMTPSQPLRVAVLQSNYIPWKGYFDIIHDVDLFVFYDDVQYTKNDWRNRNRVKTSQGPKWLTIPVGADLDRRICDVRLGDHHWQRKHWETIKQSYGKAP